MNQSKAFFHSLHKVFCYGIPQNVMMRARQSLLDYIAVTFAGAKFQREKLDKYIAFAQPEFGDFTAIGTRNKLALKEAVFLNGLNAHALDYDDGTNSGIIHLGSPIFSLLLPLAERYDISLEKLLKAAVIGYETSYTMAVSIQPVHKKLGYHATGTCGVLGATVAASYMLDFTDEDRYRAFGAACISASGMLKALDDESELKPYNVAKTASLALTSIQLAKAGFDCPCDPLGGRGFLKMMTGNENVTVKPVLLNGTYAIMKTYTKPYASCRYTHPSVEAVIHLRERVNISEVDRIDVLTYSLAVAGHDHVEIANSYSAKMSIPYAVAVGLLFGKAGLSEFSNENIKNPELQSIVKKIHVRASEEFSSTFPEKQTAEVIITKNDGTTISERVDYPKGEPENPLSESEFRDRYDELMKYGGIKSEVSNKVFDLVCIGSSSVRNIVENF